LESESNDFWSNHEIASSKMQQLASLKDTVLFWTSLKDELNTLLELIELSISDNDTSFRHSAEEELANATSSLETEEFKLLLSGEYDSRSAIVTIQAGAGGTDSQDWTEMLFNMYIKWSQSHNRSIQVLNVSHGEDAGYRTVTVQIEGEYAYGYLGKETGVHRLVRQSPFDPNNARHTSFAVVEVIPVASEHSDPVIRTEDIKMDAFRSSGPGGQNVQKVASAVRLTHIPTGIVVSCQTERSQHQNREYAMRILNAKLLAAEKDRRDQEVAELRGNRVNPEWGNQIRSYVLHPYKMVKDHRSDFESSDPDKILDGDINEFIDNYLRMSKN